MRSLDGSSGMRFVSRALWLGVVVSLCVSCAKARTQNVAEPGPSDRLPRPGRVVVFDFETGGSDVRIGSSPRRTMRQAIGLSVDDADVLAEAVADALANRLVDDLRGFG